MLKNQQVLGGVQDSKVLSKHLGYSYMLSETAVKCGFYSLHKGGLGWFGVRKESVSEMMP